MSDAIADLFQRMTHGVYVIGVGSGDELNAFTAAWVMQVSYAPLLLALSINQRHSSYGLLRRHQAFSVNVLGKDQLDLAAHFGQPAVVGKLDSKHWAAGRTGVPLLSEAIAWFECTVALEHPLGERSLVLGKVIDGKLVAADAEPMTYRETGALDGAAALFPESFEKP
jgi:flavin reductase (DIM6/NTAB) family NADH-FMN oxidoreductase RutF